MSAFLMLYYEQTERASASCPEIVLTHEERAELTRLVRSKLTSVRLAQRARIVLLAAEAMQTKTSPSRWAWDACKSRVGVSGMRNRAWRASSAIYRAGLPRSRWTRRGWWH